MNIIIDSAEYEALRNAASCVQEQLDVLKKSGGHCAQVHDNNMLSGS